MDNFKYRKFTKSPKLKFGDFLADSAKLMLNNVATPIETISGRDFYKPEFENEGFKKASDIASKINGIGTDIAGTIALGPIYGAGKSAIQAGVNMADPNGKQYNNSGELSNIATSMIPSEMTGTLMMRNGGNMPYYNNGGSLTEINSGGTHEQNPMGGIPIGDKALVEQGETIDTKNQYVFSDSIYIDKDIAKEFGFKNAVGKSFAAYSSQINKSVRTDDQMDKKAQEKMNIRLMEAQEAYKEKIFGDRLQESIKMKMGGDLYSAYTSKDYSRYTMPKMEEGGTIGDPPPYEEWILSNPGKSPNDYFIAFNKDKYYEGLERTRKGNQNLYKIKEEDLFKTMGEYKSAMKKLKTLESKTNPTKEDLEEMKSLFQRGQASVPIFATEENGEYMRTITRNRVSNNAYYESYENPIPSNDILPMNGKIGPESKRGLKGVNMPRPSNNNPGNQGVTVNSRGEVVSKIPTQEEMAAFLESTNNQPVAPTEQNGMANMQTLAPRNFEGNRFEVEDNSQLTPYGQNTLENLPGSISTKRVSNNMAMYNSFKKAYYDGLERSRKGYQEEAGLKDEELYQTMGDAKSAMREFEKIYESDEKKADDILNKYYASVGMYPKNEDGSQMKDSSGNSIMRDIPYNDVSYIPSKQYTGKELASQLRSSSPVVINQGLINKNSNINPNVYQGNEVDLTPVPDERVRPIVDYPLKKSKDRSSPRGLKGEIVEKPGTMGMEKPDNLYEADWGYIGQEAARLAPAIANFASGMKYDKLNYNDYKVRGKVKPYFMNIDPLLQDAKEGYVGALDATRNATGGNAGTYLSNISALQAGKAKNEYQARVGKYNADNQSVTAAQMANIDIEAQNMNRKFTTDDWNMRSSEAAKNLIREGFANIGQYANAKAEEAMWEEYIKATSPDYYTNSVRRSFRKPKG